VLKSHKGVRSDVCLGGKQTFLFRRARNKAANKEGLTMGKQLAAYGARGKVRQWGCGAARQIQRECHRMPGQNQVNLVIKLCSLAANYVRRSPNDPCKQHY